VSEARSREALVAEIEALRRRLGEPSLEEETGVSGRNVDAIVELVRRIGIDAAQLQEGLELDLARARRPNVWISWAAFNAILERVRELAGDDAVVRLGQLALESPLFRALGLAAGAFVSEHALMTWVNRVVWREDGLYFRGVDARLDALGRRALRVTWRGRGHVTFSRGFALAMQGVTRELPRLVGAAPAEAELLEDGPARVVLHVRLAERRRAGVGRWLSRLVSRRGADELRGLYTELVETNQLLQEKLLELEASRSARRALERRLEQRRRMEMLGRFAATIRHDFNNLLTVILNHAQFISMELDGDDPRKGDIDVVVSMAERAAALARQLRGFDLRSRAPEAPIDLHAVVEGSKRMLARITDGEVELVYARDESPATVLVEPSRAEQVLVNLVLNAKEAMPDGGRVEIETRIEEVDPAYARRHPPLEPGPHVRLSVRDEGHGVPEAARDRIFEPFYTTKAEGHGVGLATVYAVVTAAGGTVVVDSDEGRGARFDAWLPLATPRPRSSRPPPPRPARPGPRGELVLVIEDHPQIREATERILTASGYRVRAAEHGDAALRLLDEGLRPDVVVSDVVMPGIRGAALASAIRERVGPLPILFVSGYAARALDEPLGDDTGFLPKPYRPTELLDSIAGLLSR